MSACTVAPGRYYSIRASGSCGAPACARAVARPVDAPAGDAEFQLAAAVALIALPALVGHAGATPGIGRIRPSHRPTWCICSRPAHGSAACPAFALLLWRDAPRRETGLVRFRNPSDAPVFHGRHLQRRRDAGTAALINSWYLLSGSARPLSTDYGRLLLRSRSACLSRWSPSPP